jgi:tRNA/tmRNA/rRNA uracil-C5-methylase (TrmA/RlmC/RlmD family)
MIELHPHDMAHGGEAVARKDGKAHFIAGAMPGEVVTGTTIEDKGSWARVALVDVVEAADGRRDAPCRHAAACGGCQWQHADESLQRLWKRQTVKGQLEHLGRVRDPVVRETIAPSNDFHYRNRMDFHVVDGRPALYRERSNDLVPLEECLLLAPPIQAIFDRLTDLGGLKRVTLRCGEKTGDVVIIVVGDPPESVLNLGVPVVKQTQDGLEPVVGDAKLTDVVDGVTFDIPPEGFFQNNTGGAEALVSGVRDVLEVGEHETLLDAYCGVGLFGATVGRDAGRVLAIEASDRATAFARRNLQGAGVEAKVITGSVTRDIESFDEYWDVAVVDPPRKGLTERGVEAVTSAMPRRIAYVSCDPASFARDTRILGEYGYEFVHATPVDLFPQTYHVEIIGRFDRIPLGGGSDTD